MAGDTGDPDQRVGLTLALEPSERCPLRNATGSITAAHRQIMEGQCRCQFRLRTDEGAATETTATHPINDERPCLCRVLNTHGVVPEFDSVEDGRVTLSLSVTGAERAQALVDDLDRAVTDLEIRNFESRGKTVDSAHPVTIDKGSLTRKQREALELAIRGGYYCSPRQATLEDLAADLDISRQAFTGRLTKAESAVLTQLVEMDPCSSE